MPAFKLAKIWSQAAIVISWLIAFGEYGDFSLPPDLTLEQLHYG
jgi:hypothetical protein